MFYYVYVIQNELGELYYGYTNELKQRIERHNKGLSFATKGHTWRLIYFEGYKDKTDACNREKQLKCYGQALAQLKRRIGNSLRVS
ncbi:GIY-YIG nuclease family protein [Candidatus Uhrbacteria bacterium]|nr:GIY-YIG nuclease family protein [Candidatus Uhrbacteria bacterium]